MKFVATEDIAQPIEAVWARVSDLEAFEDRIARSHPGIRRSPPGPAGEGTAWTGEAEILGKRRVVTVTAATLRAPDHLAVDAGTDGMAVTLLVELQALGPRLTRMVVTTEAAARSLPARLMLHSAKLARASLAARYKARVAEFATRVETTA